MINIFHLLADMKDKNKLAFYLYSLIKHIWEFISKIIPTKMYLKIIYKFSMGKKLNIKHPKTFNEKINWKKIYDKNPIYTKLADKYLVREYVKEKIGEKYLIPLLDHTDKPEEIPLDKLPLPYIIKSNNSSGNVLIISSKEDIDKEEIRKICKKWLRFNIYFVAREWHYKNISPKIIVEKLLLDKNGEIPDDYKFHCFNGNIEFIQVDFGRFGKHKRAILNRDWEILPFKKDIKHVEHVKSKLDKPLKFKEMIDIAEILSKDFDYVRVDLYYVRDKIYFGELTFTPGAGFSPFTPEKYDLIYGKKLKLKGFKKK